MNRRLFVPLFVVLALVASCVASKPTADAQQQTGNLVQAPFTFTAAGQRSPILQLQGGQGNCSVVVDNLGGGVTIVPQSTSDINPSLSSQWNTASNIGSGSISTAGTFTGVVSSGTNGGLSGFSVLASAVTSGTITGKISCSNATGAITATLSGGSVTANVSPIPLPITCATGGGCPTPIPFPSPYPTNGAGQLISAHVIDSTGLPVVPQICDKTLVSGNISSATTTSLLAVSGSNKYFICGWFVIPTGTNATNTIKLEYGTHASGACDTSPVVFTPSYTPATAAATNSYSAIPLFYPYALVTTPAAGEVCAVTAGTTTALQVWLAYAIHT